MRVNNIDFMFQYTLKTEQQQSTTDFHVKLIGRLCSKLKFCYAPAKTCENSIVFICDSGLPLYLLCVFIYLIFIHVGTSVRFEFSNFMCVCAQSLGDFFSLLHFVTFVLFVRTFSVSNRFTRKWLKENHQV